MRAALIIALCVALAWAGDVQELNDVGGPFDGGDGTHPPATNGGEGAGYMKVAPGVANFPGPKYGLPGYKESHTWETGTDLFNPAVWNMDYYAAKYSLPLGEQTLKLDWLKRLKSNVAGKCPEGMVNWSLNQYAKNNPNAATVKDAKYKNVPANCQQLLENFLSVGIYSGFTGLTGFPITKDAVRKGGKPLVRFPLKQGNSGLTGNDAIVEKCKMPPKLTYSYSMWLNLYSRNTKKTNVMQFTVPDGSKMATMALDIKAGGSDLRLTVAQSNFPNEHCEAVSSIFRDDKPGFLTLNKWHQVVITVEKFHTKHSHFKLYVDGKLACSKENKSGTTIEPEDHGLLFLSGPKSSAPNAEVALVNFYPKRVLTPAEIAVQYTIEGGDRHLKGPPAE